MRSSFREPCRIPPRHGGGGLWAMDGAADRTQLLSVWMPAMKQRCTIKAVTVKTWGSLMWDLWFSLSGSLPLSVWQSGICIRQTGWRLVSLNESLSPGDRVHTTYTHGKKTCYWLMKDSHKVHLIVSGVKQNPRYKYAVTHRLTHKTGLCEELNDQLVITEYAAHVLHIFVFHGLSFE